MVHPWPTACLLLLVSLSGCARDAIDFGPSTGGESAPADESSGLGGDADLVDDDPGGNGNVSDAATKSTPVPERDGGPMSTPEMSVDGGSDAMQASEAGPVDRCGGTSQCATASLLSGAFEWNETSEWTTVTGSGGAWFYLSLEAGNTLSFQRGGLEAELTAPSEEGFLLEVHGAGRNGASGDRCEPAQPSEPPVTVGAGSSGTLEWTYTGGLAGSERLREVSVSVTPESGTCGGEWTLRVRST
jgi:hypothetical protein